MTLRLLAVALAVVVAGLAQAQDLTSDKGQLSYAVGYDMGRKLVESKIDLDPATLDRAILDGMTRRNPLLTEQEMTQRLQAMQQGLLAQAKSEFDKASAENKAASDRFVAQNRSKPGVKTLADGIQYRIIDEGSGPMPRPDGQVRILYHASISTGQQFASNDGNNGGAVQPTIVTVNESPMPGIKQILPMMRQGAHWEVLLPPEQAYGDSPGSPIGPNQAILFDIKMVEVLK